MMLNSIVAKARRSQVGFTLIEVITAVGIVGIVSVSLYAGLASSFHAVENSRLELRATQILTEKLEAMRLFNWEQVTTGFIPFNFTEKYEPSSSGSIVYTGQVTITNAAVHSAYDNTMRKAVAEITWTNANNGVRQKRMETLISQYGIQNYLY